MRLITSFYQKDESSTETSRVCPECGYLEIAPGKPEHADGCSQPPMELRAFLAAPDDPTNGVLFARMCANHTTRNWRLMERGNKVAIVEG